VEGFRLAGAPLFPPEHEPRGELLSASETETLLFDRTITGREFGSGIQWWVRQEPRRRRPSLEYRRSG